MSNSPLSQLKVALVYDKMVTAYGGAELVLRALKDALPQAEVFTAFHDTQATHTWTKGWTIHTSFLQKWFWLFRSRHHWLAPLQPLAFESFEFSRFDIVISISSEMSRGILTKPHQLHLNYLLTPPRFLYHQKDEIERTQRVFHTPLLSWFARKVRQYLTNWDQAAALRATAVIAISQTVAKRLEQYNQLCVSSVIYPPCEPLVIQDKPSPATQYLLSVGRLVPHKHTDVSIAAALKLKKHLVVIGTGPEKKRLHKLAGNLASYCSTPEEFCAVSKNSQPQIWFVENVPHSQLGWWYSHADALLMPHIEDFGITGLESLWAGTPVISHQESGISEILVQSESTILIKKTDIPELIAAIHRLKKKKINKKDLIKIAKGYSISVFQQQFVAQLEKLYQTTR